MLSSTIRQSAGMSTLSMRAVSGLSIKHEVGSRGGFSRLLGARNESLSVQLKQQSVSINLSKVSHEIDKAIRHSHVHKPAWFCQETISLLSAEVNKVIDSTCLKQGKTISNSQRNRIFDHLSAQLGSGIKLDPRCTQSSLVQMLSNSPYVSRKLDVLVSNSDLNCNEKNEVKNIVRNKLTSVIFENKFGGGSLDVLRSEAARAASSQTRR